MNSYSWFACNHYLVENTGFYVFCSFNLTNDNGFMIRWGHLTNLLYEKGRELEAASRDRDWHVTEIRENYTGIVCKVEVVRRWRIRGTSLLINWRANVHEKRAGVDNRYLNYQKVVKVRDKRTTSDGVVKMGCLICLTLNLVFWLKTFACVSFDFERN